MPSKRARPKGARGPGMADLFVKKQRTEDLDVNFEASAVSAEGASASAQAALAPESPAPVSPAEEPHFEVPLAETPLAQTAQPLSEAASPSAQAALDPEPPALPPPAKKPRVEALPQEPADQVALAKEPSAQTPLCQERLTPLTPVAAALVPVGIALQPANDFEAIDIDTSLLDLVRGVNLQVEDRLWVKQTQRACFVHFNEFRVFNYCPNYCPGFCLFCPGPFPDHYGPRSFCPPIILARVLQCFNFCPNICPGRFPDGSPPGQKFRT